MVTSNIEYVRHFFSLLAGVELIAVTQMVLDPHSFPNPEAMTPSIVSRLNQGENPLRRAIIVLYATYLATLGCVRLAYAQGKPSFAAWLSNVLTHGAESVMWWVWELQELDQDEDSKELLKKKGGLLGLLAAMWQAFSRAKLFKKGLLVGPPIFTALLLATRRPYLLHKR